MMCFHAQDILKTAWFLILLILNFNNMFSSQVISLLVQAHLHRGCPSLMILLAARDSVLYLLTEVKLTQTTAQPVQWFMLCPRSRKTFSECCIMSLLVLLWKGGGTVLYNGL